MKQAINIRLEKDILQAIELYFDTLDIMLVDKRIDDLKAGKTTLIPLSDVFKKVGIDV